MRNFSFLFMMINLIRLDKKLVYLFATYN